MSDVTRLLSRIEQGERVAVDQLLPLVYDELRKLATAQLLREQPGQTLQPTALVHEAYLRLVPCGDEPRRPSDVAQFANRRHFFAAAAEAMRRILIDRARQRATVKHGGARQRVELRDLDPIAPERPEALLQLDEALAELEGHDAQAAELVKLRFFVGLGHQEAAEALGLTRGAADRLWALARAWLYQQLTMDGTP
jgi:RNA polymerase sigma factor (TIGR02999 family)